MSRNKLHPLLDWTPLEYDIHFQRAWFFKVSVAFRWRLIHISKYKLKILPQGIFLQARNPRTLWLWILVCVESWNIKNIKSYCPKHLNCMFIRICIIWFSYCLLFYFREWRHNDLGVDSTCNRNEYQWYRLGGGGGGGGEGDPCIWMTALPPSCADFLEILIDSNSWSPKGLVRSLMELKNKK